MRQGASAPAFGLEKNLLPAVLAVHGAVLAFQPIYPILSLHAGAD